jgi:hypothetical protein
LNEVRRAQDVAIRCKRDPLRAAAIGHAAAARNSRNYDCLTRALDILPEIKTSN